MPTPTKATTETLSKILDALSVGASRRTAAANARIDEKTLRRWMEQGKDAAPGTKWRKFHEDVLEAEAHPRLRALGSVYNEMPGNVNVAFRFLERREPGFAPPVAIPPAVPQGPIVIQLGFSSRPLELVGDVGDVIDGEVVDEQDEQPEPAESDTA
jgi:hypothetical protein